MQFECGVILRFDEIKKNCTVLNLLEFNHNSILIIHTFRLSLAGGSFMGGIKKIRHR